MALISSVEERGQELRFCWEKIQKEIPWQSYKTELI